MKNFEIPDFDYKEEVRKCKSLDDVMGKNGLIHFICINGFEYNMYHLQD